VAIQNQLIIQKIVRSLQLQLRDDIAAYIQVKQHYEYHEGQDSQMMHFSLSEPSSNQTMKQGKLKQAFNKLIANLTKKED
jgi:hypothetical protein